MSSREEDMSEEILAENGRDASLDADNKMDSKESQAEASGVETNVTLDETAITANKTEVTADETEFATDETDATVASKDVEEENRAGKDLIII